MPTFMLVSVEDPHAPVISRLWETRRGGAGVDLEGLRLHAVYAYNPNDDATALKDACHLLAVVAANALGAVGNIDPSAWVELYVDDLTPLGPNQFVRALECLRDRALITDSTLTEFKELINHG